jgi:Holliday junction resolvase RusA-like endonuclease
MQEPGVFTLFAQGEPRPQPRARARAFAGHAQVYNPTDADDWKDCVIRAVREFRREHGPLQISAGQPIFAELQFIFRRPKGHYGKRGLLPSAPAYHMKKPDVDNLAKAVYDALKTANVMQDDCQIVHGEIKKDWADSPDDPTGCIIRLEVM